MGKQSFTSKVREFISGLAWDVFLWANRMTDDQYHTLYKLDVLSELPQVCEHGYNGNCKTCDAIMTPPRVIERI